MAHKYTGVKAKVIAYPKGDAPTDTGRNGDGTIVGWMQIDAKLSEAVGKYNEIDSNTSKDHTYGLMSTSGSVKKAWGIESGQIMKWKKDHLTYDLEFSPKDGSGITITVYDATLTEVNIEGMEPSENALALNGSWEGLGGWDYIDPTGDPVAP